MGLSEITVLSVAPEPKTALADAVRTIVDKTETGGEKIEIVLVGAWLATRRISPEPTDCIIPEPVIIISLRFWTGLLLLVLKLPVPNTLTVPSTVRVSSYSPPE